MKVGSLFTGYGGLDLAVGGDLAWYAEIEPAACTVLSAHYPDVNNLGDVKQVEWSKVERVDVLTGGYPCQPFSTAGERKGIDDERHLWPFVCGAISVLRPGLVILENVAGHLSLGMAGVIGDLTAVGYDARWGIVRASDAGAPHRRARVFIVAYPESAEWGATKSKYLGTREGSTKSRECFGVTSDPDCDADGLRRESGILDRADEKEFVEKGLACEQADLESYVSDALSDDETRTMFGSYWRAVRRWGNILGRTAPTPIVNVNGKDKLNPVFVEWMMGLPEGWVTGHGLSLSSELKMLGNGVVPQQARLALDLL